jgi:predicted RNase H-related nuclease YkuK (DUF458 family)
MSSRWVEQFNKHPIHDNLKNIIDILNNYENSDVNADVEIERRRLCKVLNSIKSSLNQVDPELLDFSLLQTINSWIIGNNPSVSLHVNNFISNHNISSLKAANNTVNSIMPHLDRIISHVKRRGPQQKQNELDKLLDNFYKKTELKSNNINIKVEELSESIDEEKNNLLGLSELVKNKITELESLSNKIESDFNKSQESRKTIYDTWYENSKTQIQSDIIDKLSKFADAERDILKTSFNKYIKDGEEIRNKILKIHGLVATDSITAGYVKQANAEKKEADIWRDRAVNFIKTMIGWSVLMFFISIGNEVETWRDFIRPVSVTIMLLYGAIYSSKQSSIHRDNEIRTRWFALEVDAITPYVESMGEEGKKVKANVSEKIFGMEHLNKNKEKDDKVVNPGESIKEAVGLIAEVSKAINIKKD